MALEKITKADKVEVTIKDINGYEGLYAVSSDGRVWSHPKGTSSKNGKWLAIDKSRAYPMVSLYKDGKKPRYAIHRLVAEAFCEKRIGCNQVNHKNGKKDDSRAENLEWVTASENRLHAWKTGLQVATEAHKNSARKSAKLRRLFTDDQVIKIRKLADMTFRQRDIAELFETSQAVIQGVVSKKYYAEVI